MPAEMLPAVVFAVVIIGGWAAVSILMGGRRSRR